ncbi:MAG: G-D-S-L family lipolytic protein, partial [Gammaproteobacteria bacterium]|nr:G-D-S-L family lipolytic protein [Gammaproteobacteria bacterium]
NSFPAILAQQFAQAEESASRDARAAGRGDNFKQPLMPGGATGSMTFMAGDLGLSDRLMLVATGDPDSPAAPGTITPTQSTAIDVPSVGPFNNMGVAGAKFYHVGLPSYGDPVGLGATANPFFVRFASAPATSMLTDSTNQTPTFFVLWLGNNDVLGYATSGGTGVDQTGNSDVTTYASNDITDPGFFTGGGTGGASGLPSYPLVVAVLKGAGAKGVLINVPDVATIPFFTTVPHDAIPLKAADAAALNAALAAGFNAYLSAVSGIIGADEVARRTLSFSAGQNPILIEDETLTDLSKLPGFPGALKGYEFARPATAEDFILLTASSKIGVDSGGQYGISVPMVDADVLTDAEVAIIDAARDQYNDTIKGVANGDPDLVLFDADAKLRELNEDGIVYGSGGVTSEFATGGAFSLDGVHPTARGYAVIANEIFKVINAGFDAYIPPVDPSEYTTVFYQ